MRSALMFTGLFAIAAHVPDDAAAAPEGSPPPLIQVVQHVIDCRAPRRLPSQHDVGEWAGQQNVAQVYATRQKLMAEIGRACRDAATEGVLLVRDGQAAGTDRHVARADDAPHR